MNALSSLITITEDGEAIGTIQQFAQELNLTIGNLLHVLDTEARDCVIFRAGSTPDRLLILDGCGLTALLSVAARSH